MIHIKKNQIVKDDPTLRVAVPTGDYNETDLIECYPVDGDPEEPTLMCQALYVVFGGAIYQQSEEITKDQVDALKDGTPISDVINNKKLIDNKEPAAKYHGRVVKITGPVGPQVLRTDMMPVDEVDEVIDETPPEDDEPPIEIVPDETTTPPTNNNNSTTTPPTNISTTTPPTRIKSTLPVDEEIIPIGTTGTLPENPVTNIQLEDVTNTVLDTVEIISSPESAPATISDVVSYAKKKIRRKLRS